jgi:hypothetical protein
MLIGISRYSDAGHQHCDAMRTLIPLIGNLAWLNDF